MGLYTSIYFTPKDRSWTAPDKFLRELADLLRVDKFDHHTVYRRQPFWKRAFVDPNDREIEVARNRGVPIEEGIPMQQLGSRFFTHMMFPSGEFIKDLAAELIAEIPEEVYGAYCPYNTSIDNGHWETFGYDSGKRTGSGSFAFVMSADQCPADFENYMEHFTKVPGIRKFTEDLTKRSGQLWSTSIELS